MRRAAGLKSTARDTSTQFVLCSSTCSPTRVLGGRFSKTGRKPPYTYYITSTAMAIPSASLCQDHICPIPPPPPPPCRLFLLRLSLECRAALKQASGLHQVFLTTSCSSCDACCNAPRFRQTWRRKMCPLKSSVRSDVSNETLNWQRNSEGKKKIKIKIKTLPSIQGRGYTPRQTEFDICKRRNPHDSFLWTQRQGDNSSMGKYKKRKLNINISMFFLYLLCPRSLSESHKPSLRQNQVQKPQLSTYSTLKKKKWKPFSLLKDKR